MTIRNRLYVLALVIPAGLALLTLIIGTLTIDSIVYRLNKRLLNTELNHVLKSMESDYDALVQAGVDHVPNYISQTQQEIFQTVAENDYQVTGQVFILSSNHALLVHTTEGLTLADLSGFPDQVWRQPDGDFSYLQGGQTMFCVYGRFDPWQWTVCHAVDHAVMYRQRNEYLIAVVLISSALLLVSLSMSYVFAKRLAVRFDRTLRCVERVAHGDLDARIDPVAQDEMGAFQLGINSMIAEIQSRTRAHEEAEGKLMALNEELTATNEELSATNEELSAAYDDLAESQQEVKASEQRFRTYFELGLVGMAKLSPDKRWLDANGRLCQLLGYEHDALVRRDWDSLTFAEDLLADKEQWARVLAGEIDGYQINKRFVNNAGRPVHTAVSVSCDRTAAGQVDYLVAMVLDISEQRRLEQQIRQTQKLEALGTLAGGIAHDFNNILFAILGNTELSLDEVKADSELASYLREIEQAALRAADLVSHILSFSRRTELKLEPLDMSAVVADALKLIRATLPANIAIRRVGDMTNTRVLGDVTQLHQVIMNLATNAGHAMRDTGGVLEVEVSECLVDQEVVELYPQLKPGPHVLLRITDSGHGMSPEVLQNIFDPFFTTKGQGEGTGMGLSVVHGIVTGMDGAIAVTSKPRAGTTVRIYLPCSTAEPVEHREIDQPQPAGGEHVLLVDDEEAIVKVMSRILVSLGYRVSAFTSAREALKAFRDRPGDFDIVVTDQTMPWITGRELAIKIIDARPDLPVILCSGFSDVIDAEGAEQLGISEYLNKPVTKTALAKAVRRALAQKLAV
ncbi:response regulator [bacterium]|nr:response regulator [bacterium]